MEIPQTLLIPAALAPATLMAAFVLLTRIDRVPVARLWQAFQGLSAGVLLLTVIAVVAAMAGTQGLPLPMPLHASPLGAGLALLVQGLGCVIGGFSARYLQGEAGQRRYLAALAAVLAAVHLLLIADHWLLLIAAWALVGAALQHLLCFYPDRAFARLAAHKKRLADRAADGLLIGSAVLAWSEVGSGSLSALWAHVGEQGLSTALQLSALGVVSAVILRTALLPVHGWLIQVMEAPTPVSALLHAGVVNLGGFVVIRFAPLLEQAMAARAVLVGFGLATAVLAGLVMLTRVTIKVRLAWSTVAQMGFMLLECGLGLYTLAALHLIGHSLYKAHAFLSASTAVREARLQALRTPWRPGPVSLVLAPVLATSIVLGMSSLAEVSPWPWWWSAILGLAWAPLWWQPAARAGLPARGWQAASSVLIVAGLTAVALLAHALPLGTADAPHPGLGLVALAGMGVLYGGLAWLQLRPQAMGSWRRWSYAGFYVDEAYTRLALALWPVHWAPERPGPARPRAAAAPLADTP